MVHVVVSIIYLISVIVIWELLYFLSFDFFCICRGYVLCGLIP